MDIILLSRGGISNVELELGVRAYFTLWYDGLEFHFIIDAKWKACVYVTAIEVLLLVLS